MPLPDPVHTHFRCDFELAPAGDAGAAWKRGLEHVRGWIGRIAGMREDGWFEKGSNERRPQGPKRWVETRAAAGAWAARAEHPDGSEPARVWRVDVALEKRERGISVAVATGWRLEAGWLGAEPRTPSPSAPQIVKTFLGDTAWRASSGDLPLQTELATLRTGDGETLRAQLASPTRNCPLVFVSLDRRTKLPCLDSKRLAGLLAGAAVVVQPASLLLDEELEAVLPGKFQCTNGAVRIYEPGLRYEGDQRRHQYLSPFLIAQATPEVALETIVRSVARLARGKCAAAVSTLEDVAERDREAKLKDLREGDTNRAEFVKILEQDNEALRAKAKSLHDAMERAVDAHVQMEESLEDEKEKREQADRVLEQSRASERDLRQRVEALERRAAAFGELEELPDSLAGVVALIGKAFADRIVFSEKAIESAGKSTYRNVREAWRCLRAMATTLFDLHFVENRPKREIMILFGERTRYELGGESETTMGDSKMADQRRLSWGGAVLDASTHVKVGRKAPDCLRVYYHPHATERRLIVLHCGDHLDTVKTN
ncbi:MAG: hypothetical protein K8T20_17945 [Planctomycetes bacterium]|nr:hypothetical protein [Planctomycetota bacterium]